MSLAPSTPRSTAATLGAAGCRPASPITVDGFGPEVTGTGAGGTTLYGLIQLTHPLPIRPGDDVKIVWRMTGAGPLRMSVVGPHGATEPLAWGPELHTSSDYTRPGDEWGTGVRFAAPGCWEVHAVRDSGAADAWFAIS